MEGTGSLVEAALGVWSRNFWPALPAGRAGHPPAESPCWSSNTQGQRWARWGLPPPTSSFSVLLTLVNGSPIHPSDTQRRRRGSALTPLSHPPPQQVRSALPTMYTRNGASGLHGSEPCPLSQPLAGTPASLPALHPSHLLPAQQL